jgi:hypothetical protein
MPRGRALPDDGHRGRRDREVFCAANSPNGRSRPDYSRSQMVPASRETAISGHTNWVMQRSGEVRCARLRWEQTTKNGVIDASHSAPVLNFHHRRLNRPSLMCGSDKRFAFTFVAKQAAW